MFKNVVSFLQKKPLLSNIHKTCWILMKFNALESLFDLHQMRVSNSKKIGGDYEYSKFLGEEDWKLDGMFELGIRDGIT